MKYIKTYEGLFDFFKKKKPVRELPTEILYEPINARESDVFLKSHDMIDFNKEELDYLSPISKYHKLKLVYPYSDVKCFQIQTMNKENWFIADEFKIYKFDDEWYLIKHKEYGKTYSLDDYQTNYYYYKVDTFDGVKQFFIEQEKLGKLK